MSCSKGGKGEVGWELGISKKKNFRSKIIVSSGKGTFRDAHDSYYGLTGMVNVKKDRTHVPKLQSSDKKFHSHEL
jgi:hypothetical protein